MKVHANDIELNVEITGNGKPLIFIHGIGANLNFWDEVVQNFSEQYKVIRYDLRGFGSSDFTTNPPLSIDLWAKDLEQLMDALGIEKASLVGWSLGGIIAIKFCLDNRQRTESLILVGSTTKLQLSAINLFEERARLAETKGMKSLVEQTFHITEAAFAPTVRSKHPEKVKSFKTMLEKNDKDRYASASRALVKTDLTARLGEIDTPALIVVGQYDVRTPLADSELMCMMMPKGLMKIIPDCGHFYPLEQPEIFSEVVLAYLGHMR